MTKTITVFFLGKPLYVPALVARRMGIKAGQHIATKEQAERVVDQSARWISRGWTTTPDL